MSMKIYVFTTNHFYEPVYVQTKKSFELIWKNLKSVTF